MNIELEEVVLDDSDEALELAACGAQARVTCSHFIFPPTHC